MRSKSKTKAEFGDFQTPLSLAQSICRLLTRQGLQPRSLIEPTCGYGNLLLAGISHFPNIEEALGVDINSDHIKRAEDNLQRVKTASRVRLTVADFFDYDWSGAIAQMPEPILLLGNPPWVTNAGLGALSSQNLPAKSNFQNHSGLDAKTGKANFDIFEWMLIRLMDAMTGRVGTLAMLCKSAVARKALCHAWKNSIPVERSAIYRIDAGLHFDASVDAVLLVTHFKPKAHDLNATVYSQLSDGPVETAIGYEDGLLLSNLAGYRRWNHLVGKEWRKWRSGIKHDCSKVMELRREGAKYRNGLNEVVALEDTYLYPMLKSSDVAGGRAATGTRWMIVPQKIVSEDTATIRDSAPKTLAYLNHHAELLNKRASSIYRGRPPFSVFGVGDYSFAPWKVAISGFYKKLAFVPVGPFEGRPTVLDDTSYFLPFEAKEQAEYIASLLNSPVAQAFYGAFVFWDSKRPITVDLLRRLDLHRLAKQLGSEEEWNRLFENLRDNKGRSHTPERQNELWPSSLLP